jgi:hypothetical protein
MAPLQLNYTLSNLTSFLAIPAVSSRSQSLRSAAILFARPIHAPPERRFFSKLFVALRSLTVFEPLFSTITSIWNLVHRHHITNTARAQSDLDRQYWDYHSNKWAVKNQLARLRMKAVVAFLDPELFVKEFILPKQVGSNERNRMISLLKRFNPEYYEKVRGQLGEVDDNLRDIEILVGEEKFEGIDTYLFRPEKVTKTTY